jgi:hypothetical protein
MWWGETRERRETQKCLAKSVKERGKFEYLGIYG